VLLLLKKTWQSCGKQKRKESERKKNEEKKLEKLKLLSIT